LGLALALLRKTVELDGSTKKGEWNRKAGAEISGKTWGFLGFGATARALAQLLQGFGCKVLAYDPFAKISQEFLEKTNSTLVSLDEVVKSSDILSIHMPATEETIGLVNRDLIAKMKPSAIIVNVGRGEIIAEADLELALKEKIIFAAALDVRASEPPKDNRFANLENVILTPHIAGITTESQAKINQILVSEVERAMVGQEPKYAVGQIKKFK
jgi:D-3-phosphoglycerate dehydrogenase